MCERKTWCSIVIIILLNTGTSIQSLQFQYCVHHSKPIEEDIWIWEDTVTKAEETTIPASANKKPDEIEKGANIGDEDPCSPYKPKKPNFVTAGRRISEIKCYDYIWELKVRHDKVQRHIACTRNIERANNFDLQPIAGAIGGRLTAPGEFPHMGAIGWKASQGTWVFKCGSSLISPKFVLTAAHCSRASSTDVTITDPVPKIVRLGEKNIIDVFANDISPTDARIIDIIVHPGFDPPKKYYDIALMELEKEIQFSKYIQPACLWTRFDTSYLGKNAIVTGWGAVETKGRKLSPELQAALVEVFDADTCDHYLKPNCNRNWCGMRDNQICAGVLAGGVDACQGDSGGPLQVEIPLPVDTQGKMHYVIGVTSFGIGCALPNLPGIYSRVSMYLDWIEPIVWHEFNSHDLFKRIKHNKIVFKDRRRVKKKKS